MAPSPPAGTASVSPHPRRAAAVPSAVFVACFVAGLLLAVRVMLHGVERPGRPSARAPHEVGGAYDATTEPSAVLNAQTVAAFVAAFGAAGYLAGRVGGLGGWSAAGVALAAGLAAGGLSVGLLARWALPGARDEVVDARYLMQGHPAVVTVAIPGEGAAGAGEIAYEADGRRWAVAARGWDGAAIEAGTEVVIERVEDGVAYVEQWAQVEARL